MENTKMIREIWQNFLQKTVGCNNNCCWYDRTNQVLEFNIQHPTNTPQWQYSAVCPVKLLNNASMQPTTAEAWKMKKSHQ